MRLRFRSSLPIAMAVLLVAFPPYTVALPYDAPTPQHVATCRCHTAAPDGARACPQCHDSSDRKARRAEASLRKGCTCGGKHAPGADFGEPLRYIRVDGVRPVLAGPTGWVPVRTALSNNATGASPPDPPPRTATKAS